MGRADFCGDGGTSEDYYGVCLFFFSVLLISLEDVTQKVEF